MVRFITSAEAATLLDMPQAIQLMEQVFSDLADGAAVDSPRRRTRQPGKTLHIMQAIAPRMGVAGFKAGYSRGPGLIHLFDFESGRLEAMIEADWLGRMRTAATTAVATRRLARTDADTVACFGLGRHGSFQLEAVAAVRRLKAVTVYGRDGQRVAGFCDAMTARLGVPVRAAGTPREALAGAAIVNLITPSASPLFDGALLAAGQHVNAAGSNEFNRSEIDLEAIKRSDLIVVDSREVAQAESGDLLPAVNAGLLQWEQLPCLAEIVSGQRPARTSAQQITLFESHGMCIEDLYVGKHVLDLARQRNIGIDLPIEH
jgi:ornithine cyclodeaminase